MLFSKHQFSGCVSFQEAYISLKLSSGKPTQPMEIHHVCGVKNTIQVFIAIWAICQLAPTRSQTGWYFTNGRNVMSKVVSTHLWNTPLNLYQQAIKGFLSYFFRGLVGVCS